MNDVTDLQQLLISNPLDDNNKCLECYTNEHLKICDNCRKYVCFSGDCCEKFPHYDNSILVICNSCKNMINKKLKILVNFNDLELLKKE